jgi:hypothetical protein
MAMTLQHFMGAVAARPAWMRSKYRKRLSL